MNALLGVLVTRAPVLIILLAGLTLVIRRSAGSLDRTAKLAAFGMAALLVTTVADGAVRLWDLTLPEATDRADGSVVATVAFLLGLGNAVGIGLLVMAVVARVTARQSAVPPWPDRPPAVARGIT